MAVSNTYTLEGSYGAKVVVRGAGFILNNEMGDFNSRPGVTTTTGRIGTEPNLVAPGKRMLSSQTPTIVRKNGKPFLITGSPGGRTIINTVLCVVTNVIDFEMDIQTAVDAPRQHHQWFPDQLLIEGKDTELTKKLESLGHKVRTHRQGDAHSIWIDPKTGLYHGAADRRINGKAAGY
jgi:gamma-glutamyltranspeptidase/glutathione hydrolase